MCGLPRQGEPPSLSYSNRMDLSICIEGARSTGWEQPGLIARLKKEFRQQGKLPHILGAK